MAMGAADARQASGNQFWNVPGLRTDTAGHCRLVAKRSSSGALGAHARRFPCGYKLDALDFIGAMGRDLATYHLGTRSTGGAVAVLTFDLTICP